MERSRLSAGRTWRRRSSRSRRAHGRRSALSHAPGGGPIHVQFTHSWSDPLPAPSNSSNQFTWLMKIVRTNVSFSYPTVGRVQPHRFSGAHPEHTNLVLAGLEAAGCPPTPESAPRARVHRVRWLATLRPASMRRRWRSPCVVHRQAHGHDPTAAPRGSELCRRRLARELNRFHMAARAASAIACS
jgi:hypothetical protein